jgi:hypothetical protein
MKVRTDKTPKCPARKSLMHNRYYLKEGIYYHESGEQD